MKWESVFWGCFFKISWKNFLPTKKPHNYHKIAVWQKDDRIRKSPLKFYVYHYSEPSGDCQASIFLSFRCLLHETLNLLCWIYTTFISIFFFFFTETQVNHRVSNDRKYRITLCCSLILTFIEFITWHCGKDFPELRKIVFNRMSTIFTHYHYTFNYILNIFPFCIF